MSTYLYQAWIDMKRRCHDPRHWHFNIYGARGITVCEVWRNDFATFARDVGERPSSLHSLDRRENARGYEPGNVRWATREEQQNNKSTSRKVTQDGCTLTIAQWARRLGMTRQALHSRLTYRGMTLAQVIDAKINSLGSIALKVKDLTHVSRGL